MFGLIFLIPSVNLITFTDELCSYSLLLAALADAVVNNNWRRYRLLWVIIGIVTFYALYSVFFLNNNTSYYIVKDWAIELKPYIPFAVLLVVKPKFDSRQKQIIKYICYANCVIASLIMAMGRPVIEPLIVHSTYATQTIFISAIYVLYCSLDDNFQASRRTLYIVIIMLSIALISVKAKYFGIYILSVYFLLFYKPGVIKHVTPTHALGLIALGIIILIATWNKIEYYFLTGNSDKFDPTVAQSFARPVLYATGFLIMSDYFPFGSGLASFASATSAENYSNTYYEYGINNVHGLSPNSDVGFFCDAFYPSLAQFGVAGLILFIWFWMYAYSLLRAMIRDDSSRYRIIFSIGSIIICFILIESIAATTLTHTSGLIVMSLLGIICGKGVEVQDANKNKHAVSIQSNAIKI